MESKLPVSDCQFNFHLLRKSLNQKKSYSFNRNFTNYYIVLYSFYSLFRFFILSVIPGFFIAGIFVSQY